MHTEPAAAPAPITAAQVAALAAAAIESAVRHEHAPTHENRVAMNLALMTYETAKVLLAAQAA